MPNPRRLLLLALTAAVAGLAPAAAAGLAPAAAAADASPATIVKACSQHDYALPGHYAVASLKAAYNSIPPASREYSTCAQVIQTKLTDELRTQHVTPSAGGGGGSGFPVVIVVIAVIVVLGCGGAFSSYRRTRR